MAFRSFRRRSFRRTARKYQWVRVGANDTATPAAPTPYQEDLLASYKTNLGIIVNLPEITIWRIHLKISVTIRFIASITNTEAAGVNVAVFVEDPTNVIVNSFTKPYSEQFMWWQTTYVNEAVMMGEAAPANSGNFVIVKEYDIKARRRLRNIDDSLLLQVSPVGSAVASMQGLAWNASTLITVGHR